MILSSYNETLQMDTQIKESPNLPCTSAGSMPVPGEIMLFLPLNKGSIAILEKRDETVRGVTERK